MCLVYDDKLLLRHLKKGENIMTWVIGDIHGMLCSLKMLVWSIEEVYTEPEKTKLIFLGDYIDYGPSSKEVIDFIEELPCQKVLLMGNHEDMLLDFFNNGVICEKYKNAWLRGNGGQATINSFFPELRVPYEKNDEAANAFKPEQFPLDKKYLDFLNNLKCSYTEKIGKYNFLFTHAGLNDRYDIDSQLSFKNQKEMQDFIRKKEEQYLNFSILWNRAEQAKKVKDYIMVHGHTPTFAIKDCFFYEIHGFDQDSICPFLKFDTGRDSRRHYEESYEDSKDLPKFESPKTDKYLENGFAWRGKGATMDKLISINIDTGAVMGKKLTALMLSEEHVNNGVFYMRQVVTNEGFYTTNNEDPYELPDIKIKVG